MRRRELLFGMVALASGAMPAQESLEVTGGLQRMLYDYLTRIARNDWEQRAALVVALRTTGAVRQRQEYIHSKLLEELGGFPRKSPLKARITGTLERDGYRVEKLIYESQPRFYVTANVYVPTRGKPPFPAVIGTAGHSAAGKAYSLYQRGWIGLVKRGYVVVAFDPPGQGERSEYYDPALGRSRLPGGGTREHTMAGIQCLLTGTNFARYEIWDGIRALDYLLTRPDVDSRRIAVAGNSGGGTQSAYLAALEPRLAAATPSCYLTSWETLWSGPGPQDAEQVFVNFLKDGLDFGDFLIAFASRPIEMMTATRDFFPIDGARATYAEARRIYGVLGDADRIGFFEYDDEHGWSKPRREATYRWLDRWLQGRTDDGTEPDFQTEPESNLNCTPTGQVATSLHGETVQSLNLAVAERIYPRRAAAGIADASKLRRAISSWLGVSVARGAPPFSRHGQVDRDGYRIEKITIKTEPDISVPALVFVPGAGEERKAAVLYVNAAGKAADAEPGGDIEALVRTGRIVMAVDPRGWGESAGVPGKSGYSGSYQTAMRALLVGKNLAGMQVSDILRSFDYLTSRSDVDPAHISIFGKGNGGVLALYAAALEPRVEKVACERAVVSYMEIVRAQLHKGILDIVVPGVLHYFDLPDVGRAIAPRTLWIVEPCAPDGNPADLHATARAYTATEGAYRDAHRPDALRFASRSQASSFSQLYTAWLDEVK